MTGRITITTMLLAVCMTAVSCTQGAFDADNAKRVVVSFAASGITKASDEEERKIGSLDLLVFRNGLRDVHERTDGDNVSASLLIGADLHWYLVANAPKGAFDVIADEGDFEKAVSRLEDNAPSAFVMSGKGEGRIEPTTTSIDVVMSRLVSKITLGRITPTYYASVYSGENVKLSGLYLINVSGACHYSLSAIADNWCSRMSFDDSLEGSLKDFTYEAADERLDGTPIDRKWVFYAYPNPVANDVNYETEPEWSPRNTRLVLEVSVNGKTVYYPMSLPAMECNHEYVINDAVLTGPGAITPDSPLVNNPVAYEVSISEWMDEDYDINF